MGARLFVSLAVLALASGASTDVRAQAAQSPRDERPTATGTGVIRGRVVSAVDSSPIQAARVSLAGPSLAEPVFTDRSGQFELSKLAAGRYTITAEKTGFVRARYGSTSGLDPPIPIELVAGALVSALEVRMPKGAAVSGRVTDELGNPVIGSPMSIGFYQ